MKRKFTKEFCKYFFGEEEKAKISEEMATKLLSVQDLEEQAKSVAASFKDRIGRAQLEAKQAAKKLKDGYEMRDVECEVVRNYAFGEIRHIRTDTGECVHVKVMTQEERQMHLEDYLDEEKGSAPAKAENEPAEATEAAEVQEPIIQ